MEESSNSVDTTSDDNEHTPATTRRIGWICQECENITLEKDRRRPECCAQPGCDCESFRGMVFVFGGPRGNRRPPRPKK